MGPQDDQFVADRAVVEAINDRIAAEFQRLAESLDDEDGQPFLYASIAALDGSPTLCDGNECVPLDAGDLAPDGIELAVRQWLDAVRA